MIRPVQDVDWHPDIPSAEECAAALYRLPPRQYEMLSLTAHGWPLKQAARRMGITPKTAQNHLALAYETLGRGGTTMALAMFRRSEQRAEPAPLIELVHEAPVQEADDETPWYWKIGGRQTPTAWGADDWSVESRKEAG